MDSRLWIKDFSIDFGQDLKSHSKIEGIHNP